MAHRDDSRLLPEHAEGNGRALERLMQLYGDAILATCFRATRDALLSLDLYSEVWAEASWRARLPGDMPNEPVGPWLVRIVGELLAEASGQERIPSRRRAWLGLRMTRVTERELDRVERLRDPAESRAARSALPRDLSAAADLMLLHVPEPSLLKRIKPSMLVVLERTTERDTRGGAA